LYQSLQVRALRRFDAVVAVHESVWRQHHGLRAVSNQICIANGIPELDCASPSDGHFAWLPESHPPLVLVVGRISQEKGQLLAIEALMELKRRGVDVLLVCAGDGPQMPILRASVTRNELSSRVLLPGYIQKIAALLNHATVLLIPSSTEGMPMILLEAMRSGVPVVASAVGGMASVLGYGRAGRLVSPGSSMQIADAISDLLDCPTERAAMKREGQLRFADHYSSRVMAHHYQQAYEKLLVFSMTQSPAIVAVGAK
jgi:glycosyltransferase involved in cell wall biosynthesis